MSNAKATGQDRLAKNIAASYAGHFVFIILGFIMPRIIDNEVGQAGLGVWDLAWSLVTYLSISMVGIGSSVNRFVAKYLAAEDLTALGRMVSTVIAVQLVIATFVLLCSVVLFFFVPVYFAEQLGELADTAGWVVGFLGASLAVQMTFDAWRGVLSGCHRWDYYNAINAGGYAVNAAVMISVLLLGGGLEGIAVAYLSVTLLTELLRFHVARKVCPQLELSRASINFDDAKVAVQFGLKTIVLALPAVIVIQTVSLSIVANLGPAMLAVLVRPLALIRHISRLMGKYSYVLTPLAGSLGERKDKEDLQKFSLDHARAGWLFAIPPLVFLFVFGDGVLELWMGPDYAVWSTTALLAAGYLLPISQSPVLRILIGMDRHGPVAKTSIFITGVVLVAGIFLGLKDGWTIEFAAGLIAITMGLGTGLNVFVHGFLVLGWSVRRYFRHVLIDAIWLFVALLIPLWLLRALMSEAHYGVVLSAGAALSAMIVTVMLRNDFRRLFRSLFSPVDA